MIDLLYMIFVMPVCAALASISFCRLNILDPHQSKVTWRLFYLAAAIIAAGVGFEALMQPQIFSSLQIKMLCRILGAGLCCVLLRHVALDSWRWHKPGRAGDNPPSESNRAPLGDM